MNDKEIVKDNTRPTPDLLARVRATLPERIRTLVLHAEADGGVLLATPGVDFRGGIPGYKLQSQRFYDPLYTWLDVYVREG